MAVVEISLPDEIYRKLEARAALAGTSLSDYLLLVIERSLTPPAQDELLARLRTRSRVQPGESIASIVAAERRNR